MPEGPQLCAWGAYARARWRLPPLSGVYPSQFPALPGRAGLEAGFTSLSFPVSFSGLVFRPCPGARACGHARRAVSSQHRPPRAQIPRAAYVVSMFTASICCVGDFWDKADHWSPEARRNCLCIHSTICLPAVAWAWHGARTFRGNFFGAFRGTFRGAFRRTFRSAPWRALPRCTAMRHERMRRHVIAAQASSCRGALQMKQGRGRAVGPKWRRSTARV